MGPANRGPETIPKLWVGECIRGRVRVCVKREGSESVGEVGVLEGVRLRI